MSELDRFYYLSIHISPGGRAPDEVSPCVQKARLAFVNSRLQYNLMYTVAESSVLLYGSENGHCRQNAPKDLVYLNIVVFAVLVERGGKVFG